MQNKPPLRIFASVSLVLNGPKNKKGLMVPATSPFLSTNKMNFIMQYCQSINFVAHSTCAPTRSINSTMSSARQTVVRGPSFTGLGKRPVLQPSHQALLLMGTSCRTWGSRRKPTLGMVVMVVIVTPPDRSLVFAGSVS